MTNRMVSVLFSTALLSTLTTATGCFFELDRRTGQEPGDVSGQAVRADGTVVPFAAIAIEGLAIRTTAADDGTFKIKNVPEGSHRLVAREDEDGDGWPERATIIGFRIVSVAKAEGLVGVGDVELSAVDLGQVTLEGAIRVSGQVIDVDEAPVVGAGVVVVHDAVPVQGALNEIVESNGEVEARAGTGADGRFVIPAVAAGDSSAFAFGQRNGQLLLSETRSISRLVGEEVLAPLLVETTSAPPRQISFDLIPPPAAAAAVTVRYSPSGGFDGDAVERVATRTNEGWRVDDVPLGPWAFAITSGALRVERFTRFVAPGTGPLALGLFRLGVSGCDDCDCDGDGIRGLPVLEDNHICGDENVASGRAIWDACESQCIPADGSRPRVCNLEGRVFDCEDDGDGQRDSAEEACYGPGEGTDCDGDGICATDDDNDRCPVGQTCDVATTATACSGRTEPLPPIDGGPVDVDAGDVDAGEVDGGEVDGGVVEGDGGVVEVDGGVVEGDGGVVEFDGGVVEVDGGVVEVDGGVVEVDGGVVDGGDVDGGDVDGGDVEVDAGVDAGIPQIFIDAGPPIQNGFVKTVAEGWRATSATEIYFNRTAVVFEGGFEPIPNCAIRRAAQSTPIYLVAAFDEAGDCLFQLLYHDVVERPAIASAPNQGLYVALAFNFAPQNGEVNVGENVGGSDVLVTLNQPIGIVLSRHNAAGDVEAGESIDAVDATTHDLQLVSHPLSTTVTLAGLFRGVDGTEGSIEIPSTATVSTETQDVFVASLASDLSGIDLFDAQDASENAVQLGSIFPLTPTTIGMVIGSADRIFEGTSAELAPSNASTILAELTTTEDMEVVWARRVGGTLGIAAIGPAFDTGGMLLAKDTPHIPPEVVFGDGIVGAGKFPLGPGPTTTTDIAGATTRIFSYDPSSDSFLTIATPFQGVATVFFVDAETLEHFAFEDEGTDLSAIVELEVGPTGDLIFVTEVGANASIMIDPVGVGDTVEVDPSVAVGTDIAIGGPQFSEIFYVDDANDLVRRTIGIPLGTKTPLRSGVTGFAVAAGENTIVFSDGGSLYSSALDSFNAVLETAIPQGLPVTDIAFDAETDIAYVVVEGFGIFELVIGSGTLVGPISGTSDATSVAIRRGRPLALYDQAGARVELPAAGAMQVIEVLLGDVVVNASGGTLPVDVDSELLPLGVSRIDGIYTISSGVAGGPVPFDGTGGVPVSVSADDFVEQGGFTPEAFVGRFSVNGADLVAHFVDQTEVSEFAVDDQPPVVMAVDGSTGMFFDLPAEGRASNAVFGRTAPGAGMWRTTVVGSPPPAPKTLVGELDLRTQAFDLASASDVKMAADRVFVLGVLTPSSYFPGEACAFDLTGESFLNSAALFVFDDTGTCLYVRGHIGNAVLSFAPRSDGGVVTSLVIEDEIDVIDTRVAPAINQNSNDGSLLVTSIDPDGFEEAAFDAFASAGFFDAKPFALSDGGFGAALVYRDGGTVNYPGGGASDVLTADLDYDNIFVAAANVDGSRRAAYEYTSTLETPSYIRAVAALGDDGVVVASFSFPAVGEVNGVATDDSINLLTEISLLPAVAAAVENVNVVDNGSINRLAVSPGGTQIVAIGTKQFDQTSFVFPHDIGVSDVVAPEGAGSFAVIYDRGGPVSEVAFVSGLPGLTDAAINSLDHVTFSIAATIDQSGWNLELMTSGRVRNGSVGTGESRVDLVRIEAAPLGFVDVGSNVVIVGSPDTIKSAWVPSVPYRDEGLAIATTSPTPQFDGVTVGAGANRTAPILLETTTPGITRQ